MSDNVGKGFSLVMELADHDRLPELMGRLGSPEVKPNIQRALASLDYLHFARFLPLWGHGLLLIVTEFDGEMHDYVMDFAAALDTEFSLILSYMKGYDARHLPVSAHPNEFWAYVDRNTGPKVAEPGKLPPYEEPFCGYPGVTALDVGGVARAKRLPPAPNVPLGEPDLEQVQAHIINGYRATRALHVGFTFNDPPAARSMLGRLLDRSLIASDRAAQQKHSCVTLGLTHAGLQALGVPHETLMRFPVAFREGPRLRKERLGDVGRSDPTRWTIPGLKPRASGDGPQVSDVVHGLVSVYSTGNADALKAAVQEVSSIMEPYATVCFTQDAEALGTHGEIHFGYRDGIGQPRFPAARSTRAGKRPLSPVGDLLLGRAYRNARGGCYIGELPEALATHGTYAALRVIEQDVVAFEQLLADVKATHGVEHETTAAKLVGRWRDGTPLALRPEALDPAEKAPKIADLDDFDYAAPNAPYNDHEGRRCPFGAHVRRLNPRSGMVLGVPWGRRIVRRGMPYGPPFAGKPDGEKRGLVGLFLCGDLESQFEFIQHVWSNDDLSGPGLRHTQDVFGSREQATPFRFRPRETDAELTVMVPPLTTTIGSAYLFMPGLKGLRWLANEGWAGGAT